MYVSIPHRRIRRLTQQMNYLVKVSGKASSRIHISELTEQLYHAAKPLHAIPVICIKMLSLSAAEFLCLL